MESIIDIQLVKEQLKLLGHDVADDVIMEFVKGLNKAPGGSKQPACTARACSVSPNSNDAAVKDATAGLSNRLDAALSALGSSKAATRQPAAVQPLHSAASRGTHPETDAAPSKLKQAPDQQSPKRVPAAGLTAHEQDSPPPTMLQRPELDQRCRNFLSRCSDKPSSQQQQLPPQHQQPPILLQVPQVPGSAHTNARSSNGVSSTGSSELVLAEADVNSESSVGSVHSLGQQHFSATRLLGQTLPKHVPDAALGWAHPQQQQQLQSQLGVELAHDDSSSGSESEGSSVGLEAEGSKFLLHQAATMQRVRARLAAKMAGYTAAAAASPAQAGSGRAQPQRQHAASGARADGADISDASSRSAASSASSSQSNGPADNSSSELPRYGFRPGYRPIGIHMPPPPSPVAVEALAAARALRQQATISAPAAAAKGCKAAPTPPLKLDMPQQMESLTSAVNRLHEQQQANRQQHGSLDPLQLPSVAGISSSLHLVASPGKAACSSAVAGARASASIIGADTPPCIAAFSSKTRKSPDCRQPPRVDPLYLAPSSPRRSNPATPRSSPALSPAPLAPLSAAAVGLGLMRNPAANSRAAATVGTGRSASSNGSRQSLCFSAGSRVVSGRSSAQQQQREGAGGTRRISSAPATPSAVAPSAALRGPGSGVGSSSASGSYSARRSNVSHESLYCQRLVYSSQRSTVAPGVRKTDRVARFQQMQQQWSRDRFLSSGAGGATAKKSAGQ